MARIVLIVRDQVRFHVPVGGNMTLLYKGIKEVLEQSEMALTASEIAEKLRSRVFSYDPGVRAPKDLTKNVRNCLEGSKMFKVAGDYGIGYRIKR